MTDFLDYIYITIEMERGNNKKNGELFLSGPVIS